MMSKDWFSTTLGNFVSLQRGYDLPDPLRMLGEVPVMGSFGVTGYHNTFKAKGPGVVIGRSGASFGVISFSPVDFWPLNTTLFVTNFHGNDERFTYYFLRSLDFTQYNSGSAQPSLNRNYIYPIAVTIPSLSEQQAIAHILSSLDDKIELNHQMNETLEDMARALFKSWFVDFDPVRAKMEGRQPYGMDSETAELFPDGFEDSGLGKIPERWKIVTLSSEIEILSGGTPKTNISEYWGGTIPWVSIVDTVPGPYIINTEKTITELGTENSSAKIFPPDTIIITARGTIGNCALISKPMAMNQSCYGLRGKNQVGQLFLFHQVITQISHLKASAHGSVFDTITRNTFDNILVVRPKTEILGKFELIAKPLFDQILNNQQQSITLSLLRDTLLPKLLSGEIRVKDAEKEVEAAL